MGLIIDPNIWVGLLTLIFLEVVLGIDNLIFISILIDKLPSKKRDQARFLGISLALFMRFFLLFIISWLLTLKKPLFLIFNFSFSAKDLILLIGGIILLVKSSIELRERLNGTINSVSVVKYKETSFWLIIFQIVILDAIFSLDSVITAISIVDNIFIMMIAITIAMIFMMFASKSLTYFLNSHPSLILLCLTFLILIGFSLILESLGCKIPNSYLYTSICFSFLIEILNYIHKKNVNS